MKVKLCGFTEKNSMQTAINCKVDFLGFVFCNKSPRNISFDDASNLAKIIPTTIAKVAVVVEPSLELLQNINLALQPQYFQIHGNVDLENILTIKRNFPEIKIIKAFN